MKNMRKLFLGKIIFVGVVIFFVSFSIASAQEVPDIKIKIGSFDKSGFNVPQVQACGAGENIKCLNIGWIGQYISAIFTYGISLAIALSVVMIMVGGLIWLMSGGRQDQVGRAKEFITGALSGLFLALFSVILLQVVNPGLINFEPLSIIVPNRINPDFSLDYIPGGTINPLSDDVYIAISNERIAEIKNSCSCEIRVSNYKLNEHEWNISESTNVSAFDIKSNPQLLKYLQDNYRSEMLFGSQVFVTKIGNAALIFIPQGDVIRANFYWDLPRRSDPGFREIY